MQGTRLPVLEVRQQRQQAAGGSLCRQRRVAAAAVGPDAMPDTSGSPDHPATLREPHNRRQGQVCTLHECRQSPKDRAVPAIAWAGPYGVENEEKHFVRRLQPPCPAALSCPPADATPRCSERRQSREFTLTSLPLSDTGVWSLLALGSLHLAWNVQRWGRWACDHRLASAHRPLSSASTSWPLPAHFLLLRAGASLQRASLPLRHRESVVRRLPVQQQQQRC